MACRRPSTSGQGLAPLVACLGVLVTESPGQLPTISEVVVENVTTLQDEDGEFPPWVEIRGASFGAQPIDLGGFKLVLYGAERTQSPNGDGTEEWQFPAGVLLDEGEFLVVFLSGKDRAVTGSELHTSFVMDPRHFLIEIRDALKTQS